jgi:hypothetical protein
MRRRREMLYDLNLELRPGGRVGGVLARALDELLLDEPFAGRDAEVRVRYRA